MIKAYKLYTGDDGHSHIMQGTIVENQFVHVGTIGFKESPPHTVYDWHTAPAIQYVITLTGTLEFETRTGETFILKPGEILIATDTTGTGHRWKMIDDDPWKRAYVTFNADEEISFQEDESESGVKSWE